MEEHKFLRRIIIKVIVSIALLAFIAGFLTQITDSMIFVLALPIVFVILAVIISSVIV